MTRRDRAIWEAYRGVDMSQPCPGCGAAPKTFCTNEITGRVRRVPCIGRPTTAVTAAVPDLSQEGQTTTDTRDFSEPIHPTERTPE